MIHQNSLSVYKDLVLPNIKQKHKRVMDALTAIGPCCSLEIADYLNVPLNSVSGRFSELALTSKVKEYDKPQIEQVGSKKNRYGNMSAIWQVKVYQPEGTQATLFEMNNKMAG